MTLFGADNRHVDGGLGQAFHRAAHADHTRRAGQKGFHHCQGHFVADIARCGSSLDKLHGGRRVALGKLSLDLAEDLVHHFLDGLDGGIGNQDFSAGLEGDGVAQRTAGKGH